MDEAFAAALEALQGDLHASERNAAASRAVHLAYEVLTGPRAAALRTTPRTNVEDAEQNAVMEFFLKPLDMIAPATAPALLRTIFRRRIRDQLRREARYVYGPSSQLIRGGIRT